jgi:hypothetical protein
MSPARAEISSVARRNRDSPAKAPSSASQTMGVGDELCVGDEVRVVTLLGDEVKGTVYCEDAVTGTLVLRASHTHTRVTCDLRMLNRKALKSVEVITRAQDRLDTAAAADAEADEQGGSDDVLMDHTRLMAVSERDLVKKEQKAVAAAERAWAQINKKATPEGQEIFDALARTTQCEWEGQSIVVYDQVR